MTQSLTSAQIRERFLAFFKQRGHAILPSASLVPENDPSVLFNTAGMQPLVPYLLGEKHPAGTRLADIQKCVRTNDIDEVGDNTHLTFFEMMGNWSLGDYFKEEAINWSYEFLTDKEVGLGLDPQRLYVTCFEGNEDAPRDEESAGIWKSIFDTNGVTGERIYFRPADKNWWSAGDNGPCGPDTEMFYDLTGTLDKGMRLDEYLKADDEQKVVEIWNDVFMEYVKKDGKVVGKLPAKNVDTGSGFERVVTVVQGKGNVFDTDIFEPIISLLPRDLSEKDKRIIADHTRAIVFIVSDGIRPSKSEAGSVLRRLMRDIFINKYKNVNFEVVIKEIVVMYKEYYSNLNSNLILEEINKEKKVYQESLKISEKEVMRLNKNNMFGEDKPLTGDVAFGISSTLGIRVSDLIQVTTELNVATSKNFEEELKEATKNHQEISRAGSEQKFKGGMGGTGDAEVRYHTATHLLHQALRDVLGNDVGQKGSNITSERLRFDFTFPRKMTDEEKQRVEDIVNEKISEKLPMQKVVMKKADAEKTGALHFFGDKYGDEVNVYYIGNDLDTAYSKEFCGGPHVSNTGELGHFKITKEEAVSAGVRRIKATLE